MRYLIALIAVVFVVHGRTAAARTVSPICDGYCSSETDCFDECEIGTESGWIFTTCGEYNGGPYEGSCSVDSWDNCHTTCSDDGESTWSCVADGEASTCGDVNIYSYCGNGYCEDGEDSSSCSDDCGSSVSIDTDYANDLTDAINAAEDYTGGGTSLEDGDALVATIAEVTGDDQQARHGFGDLHDGDPCEFKAAAIFADETQISALRHQKLIAEDTLSAIGGSTFVFTKWSFAAIGAALDVLINHINAQIDTFQDDLTYVRGLSCGESPYPYPT